jgi:hypothetical protein
MQEHAGRLVLMGKTWERVALVLLLLPRAAHGQEEPVWHEPAGRTEAFSAEEEERLDVDGLRSQLPGVEFAPGLPSLRVIPTIGGVIPYQVLGVGLTVEVVPVPWLRASAEYSFGFTLSQQEFAASHYAEALVGVRLLGVKGESAVDIPLKPPNPAWKRPPPTIKAWVPSSHSLFVEGGMMTGFFSFERCPDDCVVDAQAPEPAVEVRTPPDERQLFIPMGGLRYAYAYSVTAERRNVRKRFLLEAYAHVFGPPLVAPDSARYFANGDDAGRPGVGARVGIDLPPFGCLAELVFGAGCLRGDVSIGYAPYPRFVYFKWTAGYPFY